MERNRAPTMAMPALAPEFYAAVVSPRSFSSLWDQARRFDWIGKDIESNGSEKDTLLSSHAQEPSAGRSSRASRFLNGKGGTGEREKERRAGGFDGNQGRRERAA